MNFRFNNLPIPVRHLFVGVLSIFFLNCFGQPAKKGSDPFIPYLDHIPAIIKKLKIDTIQGKGGERAIILQRLIFSSRKGQNRIYALLAHPLHADTPLPAILCLHGGGSKADDLLSMVEQYASRGYVALAPDLPGICNPSKTPNSGGPWKNKAKGEGPRFNLSDGVDSSTLTDGEIAGLESFNLLKAQPETDPKKIGITGFSWGGYSTTFLSGLLGHRIKAAYAVFGCGFYDKGSFWKEILRKMPVQQRKLWLKYLDAGRRAQNITAPFFIESATNDMFFWPEAVTATLSQIKGRKNHVWNPNLNHLQGPDGPLMQRLYFDYYLKGSGYPFGSIWITGMKNLKDGSKNITAKVRLPAGVYADSVRLYYSHANSDWMQRAWHGLAMTKTNNHQYAVTLPSVISDQKINFYLWMKDDRKIVVASQMY